MTPYQYVNNNPIMFTDPTGMNAEGPHDPPKSEQGTVHIYKFNYGNSSSEFQKYMDSFSQEDFHNIRTGIYESSMERYNTGLARAMYGLDSNGNINVLEDIKTRNWNQSGDALYGAMKDAWTSKVTGIDPSSVSMLNPITSAKWQSTRALAVTSNDEALGMIYQTAAHIALAYTAAPKVSLRPSPNLFGAGLNGGKGYTLGNYKFDAMYANPSVKGGTFFSVKQMKNSGNLFRLDYGPLHSNGNMSIHGTYRINIFGNKYGSSNTQVPFYQWNN